MFRSTLLAFVVGGLLIVNAQTKAKTAPQKTGTKTTQTAKPKTAAAKKPAPAAKVLFTISGNIEGFPNHQLILNLFHHNALTLVDSVRTDVNGDFSFKGSLKEAGILFLHYQKDKAVP